MIFRGAGTALVTPFTENGHVDYEGYGQLIDFQLENSIDALIVAGTTGESPVLSHDEKVKLVEIAMDKADGKVPIIVGTGSNYTAETIKQSREVSNMGVDGLLIVTPYYNKATSDGLMRHYLSIADAVDVPIIMYTVPARTGMNISVDAVAELSKHENIAGLKDATGNLAYAAHIRRETPDDFSLYCGDDDLIVQTLSIGGDGVISVASNVLPKEIHDMCQYYFDGDVKKAGRMQVDMMPFMRDLFIETSPAPCKAALDLIGQVGGDLRLPLTRASEKTIDLLRHDLIELGVLDD